VKLVTCINLVPRLGISGTIHFHSPTCLSGIHRDYFTSVFRQNNKNNKSKYDKNKNDNDDDNINDDDNKSQGRVCGLV